MLDPLSLTLKCSLILLTALGLASAFRRAPASRRHALWATGLAGVLALPLLAGALPTLPVPLLPPATRLEPPPVPDSSPPEPGGALPAAEPPGPPIPGRAVSRGPAEWSLPVEAPTPHELVPGSGAAGTPGGGVPGAVKGAFPPLLFGVWLAGAAVLLLRMAAGVWQTRRLLRGARPLTCGRAPELARELGGRLGLDRPVLLMMSPGIGSPVTWGWLRPVVLLPRAAATWSRERLRVVILHELVHVRRLHWPLQILASLATAIHWFNPLVWLAGRRLETERELSCDEGVLSQGTLPSDYATHLLEIARSLAGDAKAPAATLAVSLSFSRHMHASRFRRSSLERRLVMILKPRKRTARGRLSALALAGMAAAILPVAAFQLRAEPSGASPAEPTARRTALSGSSTSRMTGFTQRIEEGDGFSLMSYGEGDFLLSKDIDGVDLRVHIEDPASVEFSRDGREIAAMGRYAQAVIRTSHEGSRQRLEIGPDGRGGLEYDWSVDGERRAFDSRARDWMHLTLEIAHNLWEAGRLRGQHSSLNGRISSIRGHVSSLKGRISSIKGRRSSLQGRISSIRGHVSSLQGRISSIRGHESSLRGKISSLRGRISSLRSQQGRVSSRDSAERRELVRKLNEDIDREIAGLEDEIRDVEAEIVAYDGDSRIREVERELREYDAGGLIAGVEAELAGLDVEGKVREIEREIEEYDAEGRIRDVEEQLRSLQPLGRADEIIQRTEPLFPELKRVVRSLR